MRDREEPTGERTGGDESGGKLERQTNEPGDVIWAIDPSVHGQTFSSPTVVDGTVYVGGLLALDAADGSTQWEFDGGGRAPNVVDGTVYVGDSTGSVYSLNADDGSLGWEFETDGIVSSPTVTEGTVYFGSTDGTVYGLDADTGAQRWTFESSTLILPPLPHSSPTVVDDTVYIGGPEANMYALDADTGSQQWSFPAVNPVRSSPTVSDGTVYVGDDSGTVHALDASTGSQNWEFQTGDGIISSPTVADGTVYIGSTDSNVYALDPATGDERWTFQAGFSVWSSPTVVEGTVFVGSDDGNLYALDAATGEKDWEFAVDELALGPRSSPTVVDGVLYFCTDYTVYALEAGVTGSSEDSRVNLGTLGHHHVWNQVSSEPILAELHRSTGTANPGETITFDASASTGSIDSFDWEFGDGTTASGEQVSQSYDQPGEYAVTVTVSGGGGTDTASTEVVITPEGALGFSVQPPSPETYQTVTFEATGGDSYDWEFGDGTTASGERVIHTYEDAASYDVTVTAGGDSATRTVTVEEPPVRITDISREYGGVPIESISYQEQFTATVDADGTVASVEFDLGGDRQVDTDGTNDWQAATDLGTLDGPEELIVTAQDDQGNDFTRRQTVEVEPVPEWLEWLLDGLADITVTEEETNIDISYAPFDLSSYSFLLGGVPIDVSPPVFDGSPEAHVDYDAAGRTALLRGQGSIDADLFGQDFEASVDVQGAINNDLVLLRASGTAEASLAISIGPPLKVDPPDLIPCLEDEIGIDIEVEPALTFDAEFDGEFQFQEGTASPSVTLTVRAELTICGSNGVSVGAEVSGSLGATFDVGTSDPNLSGTISGSGKVWFRYRQWEPTAEVNFSHTFGSATAQTVMSVSPETVDVQLASKRGPQPLPSVPSVDAVGPGVSTATAALQPTAESTDSIQRLTDRDVEDREPAVVTHGDETVVVWSRQAENKDVSDGRDIAARRKTADGWSNIELLTDDLRSDEVPAIAATDDGKLLVAWQHLATDVDENTEPADVHPHHEIAYTTYDGNTWGDPTVLTDTDAREFGATVAPDGDGWLLAWESNADPATDDRTVRYVDVASDGSTGSITDKPGATFPAAGAHSDDGAVLGYATLDTGVPTGVVWSKVVDGTETTTQAFSAGAVRTVTAGEDRVVWQEGPVNDPKLFEGDRNTGQASELTLRDEVAAVAEPTLATDGSDAVLAYRAYVASADTRELVYRLDRGGDWIFDRKFVQRPTDQGDDLTIWQPSVALPTNGSGFTTAFAMAETTRAGKNDVFVASHEFRPEYAIEATGPSDAAAGETVTLAYSVWNRGDVDGTGDVDVVVTNGTGEVARETVGPLAANATQGGTVDVTVDDTGEFTLTLETGTEQTLAAPTATTTEFDSGSTTVTVAAPDLAVRSVETTDVNEVTITLGNTGGVPAVDVPVAVSDGTGELDRTTVASVASDGDATAALTVDPDSIDRDGPDLVLLDPDDELGGAVSEENRLTPTWLLQPTLVTAVDVSYRTTSADGLVARVIVGNQSPVPVDATVEALADGGTLVGETAAALDSGASDAPVYETVTVPLDDTAVSQGDALELVVDPEVPATDESTTVTLDDVGPVFQEETPLDRKWTFDTGAPLQHSQPAVDADRVYVGGLGAEFRALSRGTANTQVEWSVSRDGALSDSSPHLAAGLVFVGSGGGTLYAFDPDASASDRVAWTYEIDSAITSSPTEWNGTVYVAANDGRVHAVDVDGTVAWGSPADVGGSVYSSLAAADGRVFVATNDGSLVALEAATGTEQWRFETGTQLEGSGPTVADGTVYLGADNVYALDAATGQEVWNEPYGYGGTVGSTPTVENGIVYVGSADGHLYTLDATDGTEQWQYGANAGIAVDPAVADGQVVVTSLAGTLYLLEAATGLEVATASLGAESRSPPVRNGSDLYVGTRNGGLVEFTIEDVS